MTDLELGAALHGLDMNAGAFAKFCGLHPRTVYRWLMGHQNVPP